MPFDARIAINVYCVNCDYEAFVLGSAATTCFNEMGYFKQGPIDLYLWPLQKFKEDIICFASNHIGDKSTRACITLNLKSFMYPLKYERKIEHLGAISEEYFDYFNRVIDDEESKDNKFTNLKKILIKYHRDPFYNSDDDERFMIFKERELLKNEPTYLPLFIKSIHWSFIELMTEAHKILNTWAKLEANTALSLLQSE